MSQMKMNAGKIGWVTCLLVAISSVALADVKQDYKEVNAQFTYHDKPIHPGLVQLFMASPADPGQPTVIAVDLAADHPNQYYEGDVDVKGKNICTQANAEGAYFCYAYLGKLSGDIHVLKASNKTGGSGVFESLLFIRFKIGNDFDFNGTKHRPLLMAVVGEYTLGDRDKREIQVLSSKVIIGKDKPMVIEF
jgi:hypothetical protein